TLVAALTVSAGSVGLSQTTAPSSSAPSTKPAAPAAPSTQTSPSAQTAPGSSTAPSAQSVTVPIKAQNNSGENGTATLRQQGNDIVVTVSIPNGPDVAEPAHIHEGT